MTYDLAAAAKAAAISLEHQQLAARQVATAQRKRDMLTLINTEAARFGLGPIPLEDIVVTDYEIIGETPSSHYKWTHLITDADSPSGVVWLLIQTSQDNHRKPTVKTYTMDDLDKDYRYHQTKDLAAVGAYLQRKEKARAARQS